MLKKINVNNLRIGMYVILPRSWYEHTFLKSKFAIISEKQIIKIRKMGLEEVTIDTDKGSDWQDNGSPVSVPDQPVQIIPDALMEALHDKSLSPSEKAPIIHEQAIVMMQRLLDNPTAENIKTAKKGISEMVNLILTDDSTSHHLLLITSHDYYTFTHSVTVGVLGIALSKFFFKKSNKHDMNELGTGFFLHDLGKVNINQDILNKPGRLTDEEMNEVKRHPAQGFKILDETNQLTEESKLIVLQHHERENCKGYPKGLKGEAIHIYGRICSIADVYDALTSDRPYRKKMAPFAALKLMEEEMIDHFQQDMFAQFIMIFK